MKKRYIIIPLAALAGIGISVGMVLGNDKVKLVNDKIIVEAGADLNFDIAQYVKATTNQLEKITFDTSNVDVSKVGEYEITITYKKQVLTLKVSVTDTLAPVIEEPTETLKARVGEEIQIENLGLNIEDVSSFTLTFEDGTSTTSFDTAGEVKKKIIATDIYNNKSEMELIFKVMDANPPIFEGYGTKDKTFFIENTIDLMDGVYATDSEDGDITDRIKVSDVDITTLGEKEVTYTVEDKSGNVSSITVKITIESVVEEMDMTMYATSVATVRSKSSAESDKIGSLSYAQSVHVTGQDKNTGWYRIEYEGGTGWVSNSYLSDTKPKVETPKKTTSTPKKDTPTASDCTSNCKSSDCTSDCISDCDCSNNNCPTFCESNCDEPLDMDNGAPDCYGW